jgi:hypothetical protein
MTNAAAVLGIVSRVEELARRQGLRGLKITTERDGTTTFQHETVSVHLFEANRELHVRGPASAPAAQIEADADSTGQLSEGSVGAGASTIVELLSHGCSVS